MNQITLIQPWITTNQTQVPTENLGLSCLASILRNNGFLVTILNPVTSKMSHDQFFQEITKLDSKLIGISVHSQILAKSTLETILELQNRNFAGHLCLGGLWPSSDHKRIMENWIRVDSVVRGEGEITFVELAKAIFNNQTLDNIKGLTFRKPNGKVKITPNRPRIQNLSELPLPARDILPKILKHTVFAQIQASRGCPYNKCKFCSTPVYYGSNEGITTREAGQVADEIEKLINDYNCHYFHFSDDNFTDLSTKAKSWVLKFYNEIEKRGLQISFRINNRSDCINFKSMQMLRSAGLWEISVGVEAGSQQTLNRYNKGTSLKSKDNAKSILEATGIRFKPNIILFDPYTTWNELNETIKYMGKNRLYSLRGFFRILQPYTGTEIRQQMIDQGLFTEVAFWELGPYNFLDTKVATLYQWIEKTNSLLAQLNDVLSDIKDNWIWPVSEYERIYKTPLSIDAKKQLLILENFFESVETMVLKHVKLAIQFIDNQNIHPNTQQFTSEIINCIAISKKLNLTAKNIINPPLDFTPRNKYGAIKIIKI